MIMTLYVSNLDKKEREKELALERALENLYYESRLESDSSGKQLVVKFENAETIIASDFYFLQPIWKRMYKHKDANGVYVRLGGRKCYESEWVR